MGGLLQDLRFTFRILWKNKAFTAVTVAALALGIGGATVMYSAVDGILLRPLPYPGAERLVRLWERWSNGGSGSVSYENLQDWRARSRTLEKLSGLAIGDYTLVKDGQGERIGGAGVTRDFLPLLGARPQLGRLFSSDAYVHGNEVVLSDELWRRRFGAARDVLGQTLRLSGEQYVVVGVLPAGFRLPNFAGGVYLPLLRKRDSSRDNHYLQVVGRYAPGATPAAAKAELDTIAAALAQAYPSSNKERGVLIRSWQEELTAGLRPSLLLLFAACVLLLVIACANVANMLIARATQRRGELAVRFALGASRARVVRQLLTECLALGLLGGGAGILLSVWGIEAMRAILPPNFILGFGLDARALGFAAAVALASTLAFGLVPALRASRADLAGVMKDDARSVTSGRSRLRALLVVTQVALSFALLVGAALLGRSFARLSGVDPGFRPEGVVTLQMSLPPTTEPRAYYARVLERVRTLPMVTSAGLVDFLPLAPSNINGDYYVAGKSFSDPNRSTEYMIASDGYFETLGIRVTRGRGFAAGDTEDSQRVCVINEKMAHLIFGDEDPIGKQLRLDWSESEPWMTVVGVVGDIKRWGLAADAVPETWMPLSQRPFPSLALAVRGHGQTADLAAAVRREVAAIDPEQATFDVTTMSAAVADSLRPRRLLLDFTGVFGAIALALAAIGLYGVLAVQVAHRTRELGIRMALGARPSDVRALVVRHGVVLALAGAGVGALAALALSSLLARLLYGVTATDPLTYAAVAAVLTGVAWLASLLPARRATAIDPMQALRG